MRQIGRGRNVRQSTAVLLPASLRINTRHAGTRNDRFAVRDQNLNKGAVSRSGSCTTEASALLLCSDRMRKIRGMLLLVGASRWPAYSSKLPVTVDNRPYRNLRSCTINGQSVTYDMAIYRKLSVTEAYTSATAVPKSVGKPASLTGLERWLFLTVTPEVGCANNARIRFLHVAADLG
jgi:hypothetical protein